MDSDKRELAISIALERAEVMRVRRAATDAAAPRPERTRRPLERSGWLAMQARSLLSLVAVVEEGSFVAAARRLGYSRSTISHQIAQLEAVCGVTLIERHPGGRLVRATPEGVIVVAHGRAVLELLERARLKIAPDAPA